MYISPIPTAGGLQCQNWCEKNKSPLNVKCAWKMCGACDVCDRKCFGGVRDQTIFRVVIGLLDGHRQSGTRHLSFDYSYMCTSTCFIGLCYYATNNLICNRHVYAHTCQNNLRQ